MVTREQPLDWTSQFVDDGFAIVGGLVDEAFCSGALAVIRERIGEARPLEEWDATQPGQRYEVIYEGESAAMDKLWAQPRLLKALSDLFGAGRFSFDPPDPPADWRRHAAIWVNPYDPNARARHLPMGHIDSGNPYRGVSFLVALAGNEPFSGNTTFFPRSHRALHEHLLKAEPDTFPGGNFVGVKRPLPAVEFVAQDAGDVAFVHHLLFHSGNPSHSPRRLPRIALRVEAYGVDADALSGRVGRDSPWALSYAVD